MKSPLALAGLLALTLVAATPSFARDRALALELVEQRHELDIGYQVIHPVTRAARVVADAGRDIYDTGRNVGEVAYRGGSSVLNEARRYIGTNPTGWKHNWCAEFVNGILYRTGHRTSGLARAIDFARYGRRIPHPVVGAIAVMPHHVGFVEGVDHRGNILLLSGNHRHTTGEGVYSRRQIVAFVMPE